MFERSRVVVPIWVTLRSRRSLSLVRVLALGPNYQVTCLTGLVGLCNYLRLDESMDRACPFRKVANTSKLHVPRYILKYAIIELICLLFSLRMENGPLQ